MRVTPETALDPRGVAVAVSGVRGVASSRVVRRRGHEQVRLRLEDGADAQEVAAAVRERLAGHDERAIDLRDGAAPSPERDDEAVDGDGGGAGDGREASPRWESSAPLVVVEEVPAPEPAGCHDAPARLALVRTRVGVQGWAAVAEVALADGDVVHVGSAEAATTAAGSRRALAAAAAQALESAGAGALRIEVEGVQVEPVAGLAAAVVVLSVVSARGAEQLIGCALVGDDPGRAVVNAVLSAANRRLELAMAERSGS